MTSPSISFKKVHNLFTERGFNAHNRSKSAFQTKGLRVNASIYYMEEYVDDSTDEGMVYAVSLYQATDTGTTLLCLLNNPAWYRLFCAEVVNNVEYNQELTEKFVRDIEEILLTQEENFNSHS